MMRKALYILGDLSESDVLHLADTGVTVELAQGEVLVRAGRPVENLYFVTAGQLEVRLPNGEAVATLGVGDVIGEMSFVEKRSPNTDVVATEASRLLAVPRDGLEAELARDPAFAARFYKALATFLSDRLRTMTAGADSAGDDLDERLLDMVHVAGDRMLRLIALMDGKPAR